MERPPRKPSFLFDPIRFFFGVSAIAWAVGFARYFDHWVYFPVFPNILDSLGLAFIGVFLLYETWRDRKR